MAYSTRIGLNLTSAADNTVIASDLNQVIRQKIAIARSLYRIYDNAEGFLSGGALVFADLPTGTSYPPFCLMMLDDAGEVWLFDTTANATIDFSAYTTGTGYLWAVIDLDSTNYTSDYPAKGSRTDVLLQVRDNGVIPANGLLIGTGAVTASAFTTFTGTASISLSLGTGITWGDGLVFANPTAAVDYNTTNLKITANQLNTTQDIATTSAPTFASLSLSNLTATRIPYSTTGGKLIDSASMVFDTTNGIKLAAGSASALNLTSTAGTAVGGLLLGSDVTLYRSAADILKTDDAFHCSKAQINVAAAGEFLTISANLNDEANFQFTNTSTGASAQAKYKWDVGTIGWQQIINGSGLGGGNADQMWFYSNTLADVVLKLLPTGNVYITGDCSALSFTDRTPFYEGDAVAEIMAIKGKDGEIDHSTLPNFARKDKVVDVFEDIELVKDGKTLIEQTKVGENVEQYRDLGAMISMLVVAIQQLANRLTELEQ